MHMRSKCLRLPIHRSINISGVGVALFGAVAGIWSAPVHAGGPVYPQPQAKMGAPIQGLTAAQLIRFNNGRLDYDHTFVDLEGLGPCFNKASCSNCHNNPVGGPGSQTVTRFGLADKSGFDPLAYLGGSLLQELAISPSCLEVVPPEANVIAHRVTNGAQGYGLIEAIADADLLANRDAQPLALRGVAHMVSAFEDLGPNPPLRVGRFGWKAQVATILTFSADASLNEIGLTNRFVLTENAPNGNAALLAQCDARPDPEDHPDANGLHFIDRVTDFQRFLTQPPQTPRSGMSGETIFNSIGCNVCHTPQFTTANTGGLERALRGRVIRPYSDFLLHNMGINADFIVQGAGTEFLLKTPPLWGVRKRDPMWHDGRVAAGTLASRLNAAIALHNGGGAAQGGASAIAYAALTQSDKDTVIAFLDSLGKLEFDSDGDEDVDIFDFNALKACWGGGPYNADHACAVHDVDQDGDLDSIDAGSFLIASGMPRRDCNSNGVVDLLDILAGAIDANANGLLDSCEPTCAADVDGSHGADVNDLLAVISGWGNCPDVPSPCQGDVNGTQVVDVNDLLAVITAWGPCP